MKSKISFFNKTIFEKNMTLFWPVWVIYTLLLLFRIPFSLWLSLQEDADRMLKTEIVYNCISRACSIQLVIVFESILAVVLGMTLFHYLFVAKNANMIHSFPVTRMELFGTNVISGWVMMFVPQIVTFLISVLVLLKGGFTDLAPLGIWLLSSLAIGFIIYSMVVCCVMLTGQMMAVPFYFIVLNFLYLVIRTVICSTVAMFSVGVDYYEVLKTASIEWLSPIYYMFRLVFFKETYEREYDFVNGLSFTGEKILLCYMVAAVLMYILAYFIYRMRMVEKAGDLLTVSVLKPVFRWGVGFTIGYLVSIILEVVLEGSYIYLSPFVYGVILVLCGAFFFFIAEMFLQKSFKIFVKKRVLESMAFSLFIIVGFIGLRALSTSIEKNIPDEKNIETVVVDRYYALVIDGEEIEDVLEIHRKIVNNLGMLQKDRYNMDEIYNYVDITYYLKNGKMINRSYQIPSEEYKLFGMDKLYELELDPENLKTDVICYNYEDVGKAIGGYIDIYNNEEFVGEEYFDEYEATIIYEAVLKDIEEGNFGNVCYGGPEGWSDEYVKTYWNTLSLDLKSADPNIKLISNYEYRDSLRDRNIEYYHFMNWLFGYSYYSDYYTYEYDYNQCYTTYISFGPECENIINALKELNIITSEKELPIESIGIEDAYQ